MLAQCAEARIEVLALHGEPMGLTSDREDIEKRSSYGIMMRECASRARVASYRVAEVLVLVLVPVVRGPWRCCRGVGVIT